MGVSTAKDPLCTATGTCANHTLCTGAGSTSFAWAAPVSLLTMACVYLSMMWQDDQCPCNMSFFFVMMYKTSHLHLLESRVTDGLQNCAPVTIVSLRADIFLVSSICNR